MDHHDHHHHGEHTGHSPHPVSQTPAQGSDQHAAPKAQAGHDSHAAHDKHAGHHTEDFLKRFWICLALTIPVLLLSEMIQHWFGFSISFPGDNYVLFLLSVIIYFYGGLPFLKGMISEIRDKAIGMMTLVAIAITVAFIYSVAVLFGLEGMDFFWELATLIDIMLLGHWLEMRSQHAASRALESLVALLPSTVHKEVNGIIVDTDIRDLKSGETILIKPGEKIAADGLVLEGASYVNESMLTGESVPVKKGKDDRVIGGSVNNDGALKVKVTGTGADSYLNKVVELVESAQSAKSHTQNLADKVAKWLTLVSITVGVVTFLFWYNSNHDLAFALERMVTVMVTSCPHALGVAIPLVVAISTSKAAVNGLLIRNRTAFENARKITTVIFDKTGTLSYGSHEVQKIIPSEGSSSADNLIQLAAAVQQNSEHHIAHGILKKAKEKGLDLLPVHDFAYMQGVGVSGVVDGKRILSVGPNYFRSHQQELPQLPASVNPDIETVSYLLVNDRIAGFITLADSIRGSSASAVSRLKAMDIKAYLLTGDNEKIAAATSSFLKMDGYMAGVLPDEKQLKVKEFQDKGEVVAMTGDGVNDAPALAQADVGIAVGSGTDVAAETADIVLVNSDPEDVVRVIQLGRITYRKMIENLAWAAGYNIVAIPLAAGVLYPHFMLSPAAGAVLMSLSTVIVAFNAQLLTRQFKKK